MSLRRKIALWLCPELAGPVDKPALPFPHAQHTGSAIHKGERIIPAADNRALCEALKALEEWEMELDVNDRLLNARLAAAKASIEAQALMHRTNS